MGGLAAASVNVVMAGSWADATGISVDVERLGRMDDGRDRTIRSHQLAMDPGRQPTLDTRR